MTQFEIAEAPASAIPPTALEMKQLIHAVLDERLTPINNAIAAKVGKDEVRDIVKDEIKPIQAHIDALQRGLNTRFDDLDKSLRSFGRKVRGVERVGERLAGIEGQLTMLSTLRGAQDEQRQQEISRIDSAGADMRAQLTQVMGYMHRVMDDLYGSQGSPPGIAVKVAAHGDTLIGVNATMLKLDTFLTRWEQEEKPRLARLEAAEAARAEKDQRFKTIRDGVVAFMARSTAHKVIAWVAGIGLAGIASAAGVEIFSEVIKLLGG